jgi:hypothetical protein
LLLLFILLRYFLGLRKNRYENPSDQKRMLSNLLRDAMLVWLFYGFASHTLYRYQWFFMFGLQQTTEMLPECNNTTCTNEE